MKKILLITLISSVLLIAGQGRSLAQWMSPGELTRAHEKLDGLTDCFKCHSITSGILDTSCKQCHKSLNERIRKRKDFHARIKAGCIQCHTDHKGKDYNITRLDENDFNHSMTGYTLQNSHRQTCRKCHKKSNTYSGLSTKCINCHDDIHKKALPGDCAECHNYKEWKDINVDHKKAEYPLTGKHLDVKCEQCHPEEKRPYKKDGKDIEKTLLKVKPIKHDQCFDCHYDIHEGQFKGQKCDSCHSLKDGWEAYTFRHESDRYKGFKLKGKHKEVECTKCHSQEEIIYAEFRGMKRKTISRFKPCKADNCFDCHYDIHNEQFKGQKCDSCHSVEKEWKENTFRHESPQFKGFKLEGKHKDVLCERCHRRSEVAYTEFNTEKKAVIGKFKPLGSGNCSDCHYDIHEGQFKGQKCESCHSVEKDWRENKFRHESKDYSGFKLKGKHKDVLCEKCHKRDEIVYSEFGGMKKAVIGKFKPLAFGICSDCHESEHKAGFKAIEKVEGVTCTDCHSVDKEWKGFIYSHKPESEYHRYNPTGQIKESKCKECHVCESEVFSLKSCFQKQGLIPGRK